MINECLYCLKRFGHGGDCRGKCDGKHCLIYERDPRGKWEREEYWLETQMGAPIYQPEEEVVLVFDRAIDKKVKIYAIKGARWKKDKKGGLTGISIRYSVGYWSEEGGVIVDRPKLKLVL